MERPAQMQPIRHSSENEQHFTRWRREGSDLATTTGAESAAIELSDRISNHASSRHSEQELAGWEELEAIPVPEGYPKLDAKPHILEKEWLLVLATFNLACLVGLLLIYLCSDDKLQYYTSDSNLRLFAAWAPTTLGTITTVAARSVMFASARLDPYLEMADTRHSQVKARQAKGGKSVGAQFLPPGISEIFWAITVGNWKRLHLIIHTAIMGFITSFKAVFLTIVSTQGGWDIRVAPTASKVLIVLYSLNQAVLLSLIISLWDRSTGLKWDPTTIADQLALFHDSNVLPDFDAVEWNKDLSFRLLKYDEYRLGYWCLRRGGESKIVYGIRRAGRWKHVALDQASCSQRRHRPFCDCQQPPYQLPHRHTPYFRSPVFLHWSILVWSFIVLGALVASICGIIKEVPKAGFRLVFSSQRSQLIYAYGIRFPAVILSQWFSTGALPNIDLDIRYSQPFANMYRRDASVSDTLLLDYLWGTSGIITVSALMNKHWKVAWCSLVTLVAPAFPVLVANFFATVFTENGIRFKGGETLYYAVFCFLVVYLVTLVIAWPFDNRRLPRWCPSIADLMSFFYASKVMLSSSLDVSGANVVKKHLEARLFLEEKRFETGIFTGVDGAKHFGVDYKVIDGKDTPHVVKFSSR